MSVITLSFSRASEMKHYEETRFRSIEPELCGFQAYVLFNPPLSECEQFH